MRSSNVVIEVVGWSDWVRREWAERAPKTLAELRDPDAFFAEIDAELTSRYAERTRTFGRIVDADLLLTSGPECWQRCYNWTLMNVRRCSRWQL